MSSNAASTTEAYVYMGHCKVPKNVSRVIVHESVIVIPEDAFLQCPDLKQVVLQEGLIEIREGAFNFCVSLKDINFPSTLRAIEAYAFLRCSSLVRVDFNEGLQTIGEGAFHGCRSILRLKTPSTVITIGDLAFQQCYALKDVQLREGLLTIGQIAFSSCDSLLGINIPSSVTTLGDHAFKGCKLLRNVAIAPDSTLGQMEIDEAYFLNHLHHVGCLPDAAKSRFDGMPLHRICFYQTASATFLEEAKEHATRENLTRVDCLGMTPLHILACSGRRDVDVELYRFFFDVHPEALLVKDKWGKAPLSYAILSEAPQEIIHFLMESHSKSLNGMLPFDFRTMVKNIAKKKGASAEFMGSIIQAQRTHFPALEIEWGRIVNENLECRIPVKMFRVLVEARVSKRLVFMSSEHQLSVDNLINEFDRFRFGREMSRQEGQRVIDCIHDYAQQYLEFLKDATTMLELALWKITIDELKNGQGSSEEGNHCGKRIKIDNTEARKNCRVKCKAEDLVLLVLSFL